MAPKSGPDDGVATNFPDEDIDVLSCDVSQPIQAQTEVTLQPYKRRIVWRNVFIYSVLHLGAAYGFYVAATQAKWMTLIWSYLLYIVGGLGITAGAHRLWAHRSYKANLPMRFILMIFNCIALQNDVIEWSRDHRVHHKYSETDADPHDATKGFFFAHMGWLLVKKHPDVIKKGKLINLDDLYQDPILRFQRKFYWPLALFLCLVVPSIVPMVVWNESLWVAYFTAGIFRYTWLLHCTWAINSFAHIFGNRPYDKHINPRQNMTAAFWTLGEGWHNYHHVFPFDYRASEFPYTLNLTTIFIDLFAYIGWVTDRKEISKEMIERKKIRSGDRSYQVHQTHQIQGDAQ